MERQSFLLFILLSFSLTACFRDTITGFENCVPTVTLVSTEATPTIEITRGDSGWGDFELASGGYYICLSSGSSCGDFAGLNHPFTELPVGTEIKLDGYAAEYYKVLVDTSLYLRGKIDEETVWLTHRGAQQLADPVNEDSLKKLGLIDEVGKEVVYGNWECPNRP